MTTPKVAILTKAAELIVQGHAKGDFARDRHGRQVAVDSSDAACFCLFGALYRAAYDVGLTLDDAEVEVTRLGEQVLANGQKLNIVPDDSWTSLAGWNDRPETTASDVAGLLTFTAWSLEP